MRQHTLAVSILYIFVLNLIHIRNYSPQSRRISDFFSIFAKCTYVAYL